MPTRAYEVQSKPLSSAEPLIHLRLALLRRDFEAAESIWTHNSAPAPPYSAAWYRNGARLFLALGQTNRAKTLGWNAIVLSPRDTQSWLLMHSISKEMQDWRTADYAVTVALSLEPLRADELFWDRWLLAVENENLRHMTDLAEAYEIKHSTDSLVAYLNAKALLAAGESSDAATQLIDVLQQDPNASVLLWYTLGQAYLEMDAYREARSVLEVAAQRFYEGEAGEAAYLESPFLDRLNFSLAQAYLGTGACANAEAVFRRLASSETDARGVSRFDAWIEQATRCQTPTPTLTPWIPEQYGTATPIPQQD
jgi:tetratricopeptide (TPR) repeat protein